jgi:hypothetical protein
MAALFDRNIGASTAEDLSTIREAYGWAYTALGIANRMDDDAMRKLARVVVKIARVEGDSPRIDAETIASLSVAQFLSMTTE